MNNMPNRQQYYLYRPHFCFYLAFCKKRQGALAMELGLSQGFLSNVAAGKRSISKEKLALMADLLGVVPAVLLS